MIDQSRITKVTLIKRELERSDPFTEAAQWGDNEVGRVELIFKGRRLKSLNRDPIRRFLDERSEETKNQIIEFSGLQFDDAAITVTMPQGGQRTFYLESPQSGHPLTVGLRVDHSREDEYGVDVFTLSAELQRVLREISQDLITTDRTVE
ncbi:MAG: hypothetical protein OXS29_07215 [bacterium]|nr:hypothetical protein [bacterium]MDE0290022.1 hypothetical protein [bacterium]MDE0437645.1 hypothetical protein [bacterium]